MISYVFRKNMSQNVVNKLLNNAEAAEKKLVLLKNKVSK